MATTIDKGRKINYDQSDLMGMKPFGSIGPGRTTKEIIGKLKKKKINCLRAVGSTSKDGEKANLGGVLKR